MRQRSHFAGRALLCCKKKFLSFSGRGWTRNSAPLNTALSSKRFLKVIPWLLKSQKRGYSVKGSRKEGIERGWSKKQRARRRRKSTPAANLTSVELALGWQRDVMVRRVRCRYGLQIWDDNNNYDNVYDAIIMTKALREFTRFIWRM